LGDILTQSIAEKLKLLTIRKEDSRKKHVQFVVQYQSERERIVSNLEKSRIEYEQSCDAVETAKGRYERAADEKSKEKMKRAWHQGILDMNNLKNMYLIHLDCVNQLQQRTMEEEVPILLDQIKEFGVDHHKSMLTIFQNYLACQRDLYRSHSDIVENCSFLVGNVDPAENTGFQVSPASFAPQKIQYQPCGLWKDEPEIVNNEYSIVYLNNYIEKLKQYFSKLESEISSKKLGVEGLEKLFESYSKNPLQGDAEMIREKILEESRSIFMLEMKLFEYQYKMETIRKKIGDVNTGSCRHHFKATYFAIPTSCDYCQQTIWGLGSTNKGLSCRECGYNAHVKCEMKIPPLCTGVKKVFDAKGRSVSDPSKRIDSDTREFVKALATTKSIPVPSVTELPPLEVPIVATAKALGAPLVDSSTQIPECSIQDTSLDTSGYNLKNSIPKELSMPTLERRKTLGRSTLSLSHFKFREGLIATVLYDYQATDEEEATIKEGERITVITPGKDALRR
jgi:hypothetical protein